MAAGGVAQVGIDRYQYFAAFFRNGGAGGEDVDEDIPSLLGIDHSLAGQ